MLILPIKKKWFDMILSGEKREEYREIKPYYTTRFKNIFNMSPYSFIPSGTDCGQIMFRNGYKKNSPSIIADCYLDIKTGKPEWGAEPGINYYTLRIDKIIWKSTDNMEGYIQISRAKRNQTLGKS